MAATKLIDTADVFMDASITTGNPVYRGSYGEITFNDSFGSLPTSGSATARTCWMIDHEISTGTTVTSCSNTTGTITIADMKQNAAGKQFKFRVLATFTAGNSSVITQAITKIGSSNEVIDDKSSLLTVTRGTGYTLGPDPLVGHAAYDGTARTPTFGAGSNPTPLASAQALTVSQTLGLLST
jgi:hypothetical protein